MSHYGGGFGNQDNSRNEASSENARRAQAQNSRGHQEWPPRYPSVVAPTQTPHGQTVLYPPSSLQTPLSQGIHGTAVQSPSPSLYAAYPQPGSTGVPYTGSYRDSGSSGAWNASIAAPSQISSEANVYPYYYNVNDPGSQSTSPLSSGGNPSLPRALVASRPRPNMPSIACEWLSCGQSFLLNEQSFEEHLRTHYYTESGVPVGRCHWQGCSATGDVQNLKQHVWDTHLGLRWICKLCYHATYQSKRSLDRHERACALKAVEQVHCAHCLQVFQSQTEMSRHAPGCAGLQAI